MDQFDAFSVFFWDNNVHVGGRTYPLGQATVDVLNLSTEDFDRLCDCAEAFDRALDRMLERRDRRMAEEVQAKFNAAHDVILTLPVFRDLELDEDARTVFTDLRDTPEAWDEAMQEDKAGGQLLRAFAAKVSCLPERLNNFRGQVALMLEYFFEDLSHRSSAEYGRAFDAYWHAMVTDGAKFYPCQEFEQSFPAELSFVPMCHPDKPNEFLVAERAKFAHLPQGRRAHEGAPRTRGCVAGTAGVQPRVWTPEDAAQPPQEGRLGVQPRGCAGTGYPRRLRARRVGEEDAIARLKAIGG